MGSSYRRFMAFLSMTISSFTPYAIKKFSLIHFAMSVCHQGYIQGLPGGHRGNTNSGPGGDLIRENIGP